MRKSCPRRQSAHRLAPRNWPAIDEQVLAGSGRTTTGLGGDRRAVGLRRPIDDAAAAWLRRGGEREAAKVMLSLSRWVVRGGRALARRGRLPSERGGRDGLSRAKVVRVMTGSSTCVTAGRRRCSPTPRRLGSSSVRGTKQLSPFGALLSGVRATRRLFAGGGFLRPLLFLSALEKLLEHANS